MRMGRTKMLRCLQYYGTLQFILFLRHAQSFHIWLHVERVEPTWSTSLSSSSNMNNPGDHHDGEKSTRSSADTAADGILLRQLDDNFDYAGRVKGSTYKDYRCGFVCIIGAPNMGKSTLLNALLEEDLCITTARPQTTRHAILGILTTNTTQVCLVDTPGIIANPAYRLQEGMMEAVMGAYHDADVLLVVTDLFSTPIANDELFAKIQQTHKPVIVVVNKVDLVSKVNNNTSLTVTATAADDKNKEEDCVPINQKTITVEEAIAFWRRQLPRAMAILPCSAGDGVQDPGVRALRCILTGGPDVAASIRGLGRPIRGMFQNIVTFSLSDTEVQGLLPHSPPLYDQDIITDRTERFIASEMIRAALFESLKKELPYCCEVQIDAFKEPIPSQKALIRIKASVVVERDSQKSIVIGKNGEKIKQVGITAREKLEEFFQIQVFLDLNVKVNKDWRKRDDALKEYGYLQ